MRAAQPINTWLLCSGIGSLLFALLHVAIIVVGPAAYRYFGAANLAPMVEQGSFIPAIATGVVAIILGLCSLYAFSGAGLFPTLPLLHVALITIGSVYTLRSLLIFHYIYSLKAGFHPAPRFAVYSIVSLIVGLVHLIGIYRGVQNGNTQGA